MMKTLLLIFSIIALVHSAEVRLVDLEPSDAQQLIDQQDTSLKYAPKIDTNVPAIRYLGNEPHHVREDIYLANQYHGQDGLGGYLYGYGVPDIAKTERKIAGGDLRGAYNYISGDGQEIKVEYWDDGTGFHQIDNVPKILPKDNPQVAAAKAEFQRIWQEEAERNSKPVASPYDSEGKYLKGLGPQPQDVQQGGTYGPRPQIPNTQFGFQGQFGQARSAVPPSAQPHQGQNVQYYRDAQYQGAQSANVNQYQPQPQIQSQPQVVPKPQVQSQPQVLPQPQVQSQAQVSSQPQVSPQPQVQSHPPVQPHPQPPSGQVQAQASSLAPLPLQAPQGRAFENGQYASHQGDGEDDGAYDAKKYETEEATGPPKGFFYSFDYPVGIIVKEEGVVKREIPVSVRNY